MSIPVTGRTETSRLPVHLKISIVTRILYALALLASGVLWILLLWRIIFDAQVLPWYSLLAAPAGILVADFCSGLVHWGSDTWGSESMPILGKRLLHPFRVHHVNPADFLDRSFLDTNGDIAFLGPLVLLPALQIPLESPLLVMATIFIAAFSIAGLMTNQIHQWAHMQHAPVLVRWLQRWGIVLSHTAHEKHHRPPYDRNYCITTGWCNRPLQAIQFYRGAERLITSLTGAQPRTDDHDFCRSAEDSGSAL